MKKILFLFLASSAISLRADELTTAINNNDVERVRALTSKSPNSTQTKSTYSELAAEAMPFRRDALVSGQMLAGLGRTPTCEFVPGTERYGYLMAASLL